ncbi:MAG TPA: hypothetical protein VF982_02150, partial [Anaerolineales bacterium]
LQYVVGRKPTGSHIYLSIDEDVLAEIGDQLGVSEARQDFLAAVRHHCLRSGRVIVSCLHPQNNSDFPSYGGFLAATVLAAHEMSEDEETSPANYFTRLNQILGFGEESGVNMRPIMYQVVAPTMHHRYAPTMHHSYVPTMYHLD